MSRQTMKPCKACSRLTMHVQPGTSHVLHLILSIISVGFWVPIWLLVSLNNHTKAQCTVCGRTKGVLG